MATIWRPGYTRTDPATGQKVRKYAARFRVRWRDAATGLQREQTAFESRKASEALAARLERESQEIAAGLRPADSAGGAAMACARLVDDFEEWMRHRGRIDEHIRKTVAKVNRILAQCQVRTPSQISGPAVEKALSQFRKGAAGQPGISAQTSNHYRAAMRAFCRYLVRIRRMLPADPIALTEPLNVEVDRRRVRRSLTDDEFARLVSHVQASAGTVGGLTGPQRAALYVTAAYTGFRASGLASLTPECFDWEARTVRLSAAENKARRRQVVPLAPSAVPIVRKWVDAQPAGAAVFGQFRGWAIMARDLASAGIAERDAEGRVADFHALRGRFATSLARAGVHPRVAQKLLGHSTMDLTMRVYTEVSREDEAAAVDRLPAAPPLPPLPSGHPPPPTADKGLKGRDSDGSRVSARRATTAAAKVPRRRKS